MNIVFSNTVSNLIFYHDINFEKLAETDLVNIIKKFDLEEIKLLFKIKRADLLAQNPKYHGILKEYDLQEAMALSKY